MTTINSTEKPAKPPDRVESVSHEQRHALVLQAWEAINSERELEGVLSAVADVLVPVVPFFGVAIIAPEARQGAPRAIILSRDGTLRVERDVLASGSLMGNMYGNINEGLREREREAIEAALRVSGGRISGQNGAAWALGLAPSTLDLRIKRLGIDKFRHRTKARN